MTAGLLIVLLALALPAWAFHDTLPADRAVPLVLDAHGDPATVSQSSGRWFMTAIRVTGRCAWTRLATADGTTTALILVEHTGHGADDPTRFYAIYRDGAVLEWAGTPHACEAAPKPGIPL